jgi:hypothetical protein
MAIKPEHLQLLITGKADPKHLPNRPPINWDAFKVASWGLDGERQQLKPDNHPDYIRPVKVEAVEN